MVAPGDVHPRRHHHPLPVALQQRQGEADEHLDQLAGPAVELEVVEVGEGDLAARLPLTEVDMAMGGRHRVAMGGEPLGAELEDPSAVVGRAGPPFGQPLAGQRVEPGAPGLAGAGGEQGAALLDGPELGPATAAAADQVAQFGGHDGERRGLLEEGDDRRRRAVDGGRDGQSGGGLERPPEHGAVGADVGAGLPTQRQQHGGGQPPVDGLVEGGGERRRRPAAGVELDERGQLVGGDAQVEVVDLVEARIEPPLGQLPRQRTPGDHDHVDRSSRRSRARPLPRHRPCGRARY